MDLAQNKQLANDVLARMQEPDFSQMPANPPMVTPQTQPGDFAGMPSAPVGEPDFSQIPMHPPGIPQETQAPVPADQLPASQPVPMPQSFTPDAQNLGDFSQLQGAKAMERSHTASDMQEIAAQEKAKADIATAEASAPAYHQAAQDAQHRQQVYQDRATAIQVRSDDVMQKMQSVVDQQKEMLSVHPDGIWQKSGVNPIAGSVALLLGMGGGGQTNAGLAAIDKKIDANIADQKRQFDQLGKVAEGYNNTFAALHTQLGDENMVANQMKSMSYDSVEAMLKEAMNKTANPQARAAALKAIADIETKKADTDNAIMQKVVEQQTAAVTAHTAEGNLDVNRDKNRIDEENNNWAHMDRLLGFQNDIDKANITAKGKQGIGLKGVVGSERIPEGSKKEAAEKYAGGEKVNHAINNILGNKKKGLMKRIIQNPEYEAMLVSALRQSQGLSTRVSGPEGELFTRMAGYAAHGTLGKAMNTINEEEFVKAMEKLRTASNDDVRSELSIWDGVQFAPDSYLYKGSAEDKATEATTATEKAQRTLSKTSAN